MKTTIHNKHLLTDSNLASQFREVIKNHNKWFDRMNVLLNSNKLDVYLTENNKGIKATFYLKQGANQVFVEAEGTDPAILAEQIMTRLKSRFLRQFIASQKKTRLNIASKHLSQLNKLRNEEDKEHFNFLIKQLLPAIRGFVARYLSYSKTKVASGFTIDDLVDEIYLALYERFEERPKNDKEFSPWSFQIARKTLESFMEKHYTKNAHISFDKLAEEELLSMEEKFTADADGELIMQEDLDDISYENTKLGNEILNNDALIELPADIEIEPVVNEVLANVDKNAKRAFELFWLHEMTAKEIAKSMRMQIEAVENIIDYISFSIVSKLKNKNV